jgi:Clustered mitochondria
MSEPYDRIMHVEVPNDTTLPQLSIRVADGDTQTPMIPAKQPFQYEHLLKSDTFSSHSLFRLNQEGYHGDSWNERFQRALALPETKIEQKLLKYTLLNEINRDFISAAVVYAKTIISEYFIPDGEKSLRPQAIGGQAGNAVIWLIEMSLETRSYSYRNLSLMKTFTQNDHSCSALQQQLYAVCQCQCALLSSYLQLSFSV